MAKLQDEDTRDVVVTHPNRDTTQAKATKALVIVLLVASAVLIAIVTVGSAGARAGALGTQIVIGLLYAYFAYLVARWRSGVLPIAAGLAIIAGIFAAVSIPGWFSRGGVGYEQPPLPEPVIGVLLLAFAIVQLALTVAAMQGFQQQWQVEEEVPRSQARAAAGHA